LHRRRGRTVILIALLVLFGSLLLAVGIGSVRIAPFDAVRILLSRVPGLSLTPNWNEIHETILWDIRLPRVAMALLVGMALSVAGGSFQGLFKNPLADPYILGVSAGAALGAAVAIAFGESWQFLPLGAIPVTAFTTGLLAIGLVYKLAAVGRRVPTVGLLLAGVAVGSFCMAMVSLIIYVTKPVARDAIIFWMMGGLSGANWPKAGWMLFYLSLGMAPILYYQRELNALLLGEEQAHHLGVDVERVKRVLVVSGSLLTATTVAFCGAIGFIGLIVPHLVRLLVGPDHRWVLPASALVGAIVLIAADTAARTVASPMEIPVGLVMSILGGPFFLWLLRQKLKPTA
jgi:iron complex transport system permease protein